MIGPEFWWTKLDILKLCMKERVKVATGIGDQVAIPHGKTAAVGKTAMAVGRLDKGIEWETLGEGTTRAFVMFAVNDKDTSELVSLLSQVAIALCDEKVIETLLNTESEAEIFTLFNRKGEQ